MQEGGDPAAERATSGPPPNGYESDATVCSATSGDVAGCCPGVPGRDPGGAIRVRRHQGAAAAVVQGRQNVRTGTSDGTGRAGTSVAMAFVGVAVTVMIALFLWMRSADPAPVVSAGGPVATLAAGSVDGRATSPGASAATSAAVAAVDAAVGSFNGAPSPTGRRAAPAAALEAKATTVLRSLDDTGKPPKGFAAGRTFVNDGRGGAAVLPRADVHARAVTYREFDLNPYRPGSRNGTQRLVMSSDGSVFYTGDNFVTWSRLR
jgi:ribonuclease T1